MYLALYICIGRVGSCPKESGLWLANFGQTHLCCQSTSLLNRDAGRTALYVSESSWVARTTRGAATQLAARGLNHPRHRFLSSRRRTRPGEAARQAGEGGIRSGSAITRSVASRARSRVRAPKDGVGAMWGLVLERCGISKRRNYQMKDTECADASMLLQSQCPSSSQLFCTRFRGTPPSR